MDRKRFGNALAKFAGVLFVVVFFGECGSCLYNGMTNVPGDGVDPCSSLLARALGKVVNDVDCYHIGHNEWVCSRTEVLEECNPPKPDRLCERPEGALTTFLKIGWFADVLAMGLLCFIIIVFALGDRLRGGAPPPPTA